MAFCSIMFIMRVYEFSMFVQYLMDKLTVNACLTEPTAIAFCISSMYTTPWGPRFTVPGSIVTLNNN